jgi:hypothetical protein
LAASHCSIRVSASTLIAPTPAPFEMKITWLAAVPFASSSRWRITNEWKRVWMSPPNGGAKSV